MTPAEYAAFSAQVCAIGRSTERQCQTFIDHARELLVNATVIDFLPGNHEDRNFFGTSDYQIAAITRTDANTEDRVVYLWELKSPQSFIMVRDDAANRFRPSPDLIKAETQLIHYYNEAKGSDGFRERWRIVERDNIRLGGIIIGRNNSWTQDQADAVAAKRSFDIRAKYFYRQNNIRVLTWDRILDFVRPATTVNDQS